jgi:uncharacterized protein (TIRG00374 family)
LRILNRIGERPGNELIAFYKYHDDKIGIMKIVKILPLFGIVIFVFILWNLDWSMMFQTFTGLNTTFLLIALVLQVPILTLKALKWKVLIRPYSVDFPLTKALTSWLVGFSAGIITPGRMGDLVRAYYLRGKLSLGKSLTTVIADRIIDVFVLLFFSALGVIMFVTMYTTGLEYGLLFPLLSVFFVAFVLAVYILTRKGIVIRILKPFYRRIVPQKYEKKASRVFHDFYRGLEDMKKKKRFLVASICIGTVTWILNFFQIHVLSLSMNIDISFIFIVSIIPIITLLDALPISFSGVGTRDAAMIFFFGFISLAPETAVSFSLLMLLTNYLISAGFGLFFWSRNPISIRSGEE